MACECRKLELQAFLTTHRMQSYLPGRKESAGLSMRPVRSRSWAMTVSSRHAPFATALKE